MSHSGNMTRRGAVAAALLAAGMLLPGQARAADPIKFGVIAEASSIVGASIPKAAQLAADEINAAGGVLGRQIEDLEHSHEIDPMALYRSYQRRQLAADFRLMSGAPGPRRTAEAYLMVYLLDQQ